MDSYRFFDRSLRVKPVRWNQIREQGKGGQYSVPVTLEHIYVVDLEARQTGLNGVEDMLMPEQRIGGLNQVLVHETPPFEKGHGG